MEKRKNQIKKLIYFNAFTLGGLSMINRSVSKTVHAEGEQDGLTDTQTKLYQWKYGNVSYIKAGSGNTPLLLIHDLQPYESGREWEKIIGKIAEKYDIYLVDLPGCGNSDKPPLIYTNYFYARLISHFIEDVIKKPACIAATGLSASFAVTAAALNRKMVKSIYMINPLSIKKLKTLPKKNAKAIQILFSLPVIGNTVYNMYTSRRNIEFLLEEDSVHNPFHISKKIVRRSHYSAHQGGCNGKYLLASLDGGYLYWDIRKALTELEMPVTILYGEKLPYEEKTVKKYKKYNKRIKVKKIEKSAFLPQIDNPASLAQALLEESL